MPAVLLPATRTSGMASPPAGAASDRVAVMVAEPVLRLPSVRAVRFALRVMCGPVRTVTATASIDRLVG